MDDKCHVVITSIGTDRPGIVEELSGWILDLGGNIEDSRMSQLGGEFATLILVSGPERLDQRLSETSAEFARRIDTTIFLKTVSGTPPKPGVALLRCALRARSLDHPGIIHQVAQLLRRQSINIVSASTTTSEAPFSAAPVFEFDMEIDVPASVIIADLREELRRLGSQENIDFHLDT